MKILVFVVLLLIGVVLFASVVTVLIRSAWRSAPGAARKLRDQAERVSKEIDPE